MNSWRLPILIASRQRLLKAIIVSTLTINFFTPSQVWAKAETYDLERAISEALANNRLRTISQQSLAIAEAQYKQAASTYWPTLTLNMSYMHRDDVSTFEYPEQNINVSPLMPPVSVPAREIELLGRNTQTYGVNMTYPLYTGGKTSSIREQAKIGVGIAEHEVVRTRLQIVQDVKRYFYAALYTQQLVELADDINLSFDVLEDITQVFFEGGSNSVDKLDVLKIRLAHSTSSSTLAELKARHESALAALSFAMGLDWSKQIHLVAGSDYPQPVDQASLDELIAQAMDFNPEVQKLKLAVNAYQAKVDEAKSGHYPTVALIGSYDGFKTDIDGGLNTDKNRQSWTLGLGMEMKLFDGGLTRHKVSAARLSYQQMKQQRLLLNDGVAAQIKQLFLSLKAAKQQIDITESAVETSKQNRSLTSRAYRTGAVDTQKVIEAELFDAMLQARYFRAKYQQAQYLADISYLLGQQVFE